MVREGGEKIRWWSGKEEGSNVSYFVLCVVII